jgi:hypothetical protein
MFANCELGVSITMLSWGTLSTLHIYLVDVMFFHLWMPSGAK